MYAFLYNIFLQGIHTRNEFCKYSEIFSFRSFYIVFSYSFTSINLGILTSTLFYFYKSSAIFSTSFKVHCLSINLSILFATFWKSAIFSIGHSGASGKVKITVPMHSLCALYKQVAMRYFVPLDSIILANL